VVLECCLVGHGAEFDGEASLHGPASRTSATSRSRTWRRTRSSGSFRGHARRTAAMSEVCPRRAAPGRKWRAWPAG
jgi:hypothetical protein